MNDTTNEVLTDEQRKAFANLIKDAQQRYERDFDDRLKSLKDTFGSRFEATSKTRQVMEQIRGLRAKLSEAADQLRRYGFRVVDDGFVSVDYDVSSGAHHDYEKTKKELIAEHDSMADLYHQSVFNVWSAKTADEARNIVSRLV